MKNPCAWFAKFNGLLFAFGFTSRASNLAVLTKKTNGDLIILAVLMIFFFDFE